MASLTMTASFLGGANITRRPSINRRSFIAAQAAKSEGQDAAAKVDWTDQDSTGGRRAVMFAAVAAVVGAVGFGQGGAAMAGVGDPKPGTPEAKKLYAPVCVTMPTARICHK